MPSCNQNCWVIDMNPLISILLIVLAAFVLILLAAFVLSLIVVAAGKKYSLQQRQALLDQITAILKENDCGDEQLAQQLLDGQAQIPQTLSQAAAEGLNAILTQWQQEQERIRLESETNRKKRKKKLSDLLWQVDK